MKIIISSLMLSSVALYGASISLGTTQDSNHLDATRGTQSVVVTGLGTSTVVADYTFSGVNLTACNGPASANVTYTITFTATGGNIVNAAGGRLGVDGTADLSNFIEAGESITATITGGNYVDTIGFNNFQVWDISDYGDQFDITSDRAAANQNDVTFGPDPMDGSTANFAFYTFLGNTATSVGVSGDAGEVSFGNLGVTVTAIPEPSSSALLGLGALGLLARRRRA